MFVKLPGPRDYAGSTMLTLPGQHGVNTAALFDLSKERPSTLQPERRDTSPLHSDAQVTDAVLLESCFKDSPEVSPVRRAIGEAHGIDSGSEDWSTLLSDTDVGKLSPQPGAPTLGDYLTVYDVKGLYERIFRLQHSGEVTRFPFMYDTCTVGPYCSHRYCGKS